MKINFILLAAALFGVTACNNGSESNTTNSDTSATDTTSATEQKSTAKDTATSHADLMKPMDNIMVKMQSMQMTGDFDIDFANMMIEHHQGAIDMAQIELSNGKDEKMKAKAQEIITKQNDEQQKLRDFVSNYKPSGMKHGEGEMQKAMTTMSSKMKSMQMTGDTDKDFATMMSTHHADGISMSKMELKNGMSSQLKKMAQKGINDQQKDINEFKEWLTNNTK